jgi:hypothetical protein
VGKSVSKPQGGREKNEEFSRKSATENPSEI